MLAPGRAERPDAFAPTPAVPRPEAVEHCPFCEGREKQTPLEIWADRPSGEANTPGWRVRSVPNLYPVLGTAAEVPVAGENEQPGAAAIPKVSAVASVAPAETSMSSSADPLAASTRGAPDLFASQPADGIHEVIVNTPRHEVSLGALSEGEIAVAVAGWRERMRDASEESSYVHLIVNEGVAAGASREHTHAQLYGMRFVPAEVARERERTTAYHQRTMGSHMLGDVATQEVRRRERLVAIDDDAILIAPWASRSPFELRIIPRTPAPSFERHGETGAAMLATALRGLSGVFGELPQLNLWIRTAPSGSEEFCWHIDIIPKLTIRAGFELGTGVDINVYAPEKAAGDLREALA
ncbi:galactose-1-phosphate uridylyltransferase [soil metagenome]